MDAPIQVGDMVIVYGVDGVQLVQGVVLARPTSLGWGADPWVLETVPEGATCYLHTFGYMVRVNAHYSTGASGPAPGGSQSSTAPAPAFLYTTSASGGGGWVRTQTKWRFYRPEALIHTYVIRNLP